MQRLRQALLPHTIRERFYPLYFELRHLFRYRPPKSSYPQVFSSDGYGETQVDSYWNVHTVKSVPFLSSRESLDYLEWRFKTYPLVKELMALYGDHLDETILDYGCGPGNDVIGFLQYSKARKVIGMDVSRRALSMAARRIALHGFPLERVLLQQLSDTEAKIPLEDASVDYFVSAGVIHHTSDPAGILCELYRVLRPGGYADIMVYNYRSIMVHLYIAYYRLLIEKAYPGENLAEVFQRSTDGEDCPISRYYRAEEFLGICEQAGFTGEFRGGHFGEHELDWWRQWTTDALKDSRLPEEHRLFLQSLTTDSQGYPLFNGYYAGIGGVYRLYKAK